MWRRYGQIEKAGKILAENHSDRPITLNILGRIAESEANLSCRLVSLIKQFSLLRKNGPSDTSFMYFRHEEWHKKGLREERHESQNGGSLQATLFGSYMSASVKYDFLQRSFRVIYESITMDTYLSNSLNLLVR